jgi:hypothetical protein
MNNEVLAAVSALPQNKGYRFTPIERSIDALHINPRDPEHDGVSKSLCLTPNQEGMEPWIIAQTSSDGVTYCCGVTLEAWFDGLALLDINVTSLFQQYVIEHSKVSSTASIAQATHSY